MSKTRALHAVPAEQPHADGIALTNEQAIGALSTLRRFGNEVKAHGMLKFRLAMIASALAAHVESVAAVQQQLHKDFLGDDPSKAQAKDVVAFNRATDEIARQTHRYTFTPISKADLDAILAIDALPCPVEPLFPLLAPEARR